jgi:hypothetical protein
MANKIKKFIQHSRQFFNTYPKIKSLKSKEDVKEFFLSKVSMIKAKIKHLVISYETGQEEHDSKNYEHFHVLVKFDRPVKIRSADFWDLNGVHGHYKTLNKGRDAFRNTAEYCKKDGDYIEEIDRKPDVGVGLVKATNDSSMLSYLISEIAKYDPKSPIEVNNALKAIVGALNLDSRSVYHMNEKTFEKCIYNQFKWDNNTVNNYNMCTFNVPEEMKEWMLNEMNKRSLIMYGKSGTGKTSLAKAIFKNPLIVTNLEKLKHLKPEHDGIIFDDFCFRTLVYEQKIHLLDIETERDFSVKFGHVVIGKGIPRIFTTNRNLEEFIGTTVVPDELNRRIIAIEVRKSLISDKDK